MDCFQEKFIAQEVFRLVWTGKFFDIIDVVSVLLYTRMRSMWISMFKLLKGL